jgi:hypothetical protein
MKLRNGINVYPRRFMRLKRKFELKSRLRACFYIIYKTFYFIRNFSRKINTRAQSLRTGGNDLVEKTSAKVQQIFDICKEIRKKKIPARTLCERVRKNTI